MRKPLTLLNSRGRRQKQTKIRKCMQYQAVEVDLMQSYKMGIFKFIEMYFSKMPIYLTIYSSQLICNILISLLSISMQQDNTTQQVMTLENVKKWMGNKPAYAAVLFLNGCASQQTRDNAITIFQQLQISQMTRVIFNLGKIKGVQKDEQYLSTLEGLKDIRDTAYKYRHDSKIAPQDKGQQKQVSSYKGMMKQKVPSLQQTHRQLAQRLKLMTQEAIKRKQERTIIKIQQKTMASPIIQEQKIVQQRKDINQDIPPKRVYTWKVQEEENLWGKKKKKYTLGYNNKKKILELGQTELMQQKKQILNKQGNIKSKMLYQTLKKAQSSYGTLQQANFFNSYQLQTVSQTNFYKDNTPQLQKSALQSTYQRHQQSQSKTVQSLKKYTTVAKPFLKGLNNAGRARQQDGYLQSVYQPQILLSQSTTDPLLLNKNNNNLHLD